MFDALFRFATKFRLAIILAWLVVAAALFLLAPSLSEVGVTDESQFLPKDTPSATAGRILNEKFASVTENAAGSGLILIYDANGLSDADMQDAQSIYEWLISDSAPPEITGVVSIFDNENLRARLISQDQTAMLMNVDFSVGALSEAAGSASKQIETYLSDNYPGETIYFTGEIGLYHDMLSSIEQTIDRTTYVTLILVVILLLIIYRSPVAITLPLLVIGASFGVSIGLLGFLGQAGVKFSTLSEAYLIVIIFGVGTDYCLFIISRFREELVKRERVRAQGFAFRQIGPVIAASALTVVVAFLSLGISNFGMNQTMGYALAIGVLITLAAGLTLLPALISLFGKFLFWPIRTSVAKPRGRFGWHAVGDWISRYPVAIILPVLILMLVPYLALPEFSTSAGIINQLPQGARSVQGYKVMAEHFPVGEMSPTYVLIESNQPDMTNQQPLQEVGQIAASLEDVPDVSRVVYPALAEPKLQEMAGRLASLGNALGQGQGLDQLLLVEQAGELAQTLAFDYPAIVQSTTFLKLSANLGEIQSLANQIPNAGQQELPALISSLSQKVMAASDNFGGLAAEFRLEIDSPLVTYLLNNYFSTDRTTTRINVMLSSVPSSSRAIETIGVLKNTLDEALKPSPLHYYIGGESAVYSDIMATNNADFGRVVGLSIAGIFLVIVVLLRSLVAPLYMVATVLLNFGTTLGISTWLFLDLLDQGSMVYMVPLFVYIVLAALGADYNIFLVSRIREESQLQPAGSAISHAVANTGGVITACGVILGGTFATLMTSPLEVVFQIGAAIALGIFIDTFLVRAFLVPALARIFGRWNWWPSRLFTKMKGGGE